MRLSDVVLRRGHLSEAALAEAWNTGVRPAHLDRCDICDERAIELSHWLESVQALGKADADAVFTPERLTAQRGQIMQRLEHLDRPAKVISFPARSARSLKAGESRRVSPGWLAAAAAAGLTLGVVSVELSHTLQQAPESAQLVTSSAQAPASMTVIDASALDLEGDPYSRTHLGPLHEMDEMTPYLVDVVAFNR